VFYVGKSSVGESRPLSHLFNSHSDKVNDWVKSLEEKWLYPKISIIEEVEKLDDLPDREIYWIQHYSSLNPDLLNYSHNPKNLDLTLLNEEDLKEFEIVSRNIGNIHVLFKKHRIARKITQDEISELMDCSRSTISLFERGENVNFDIVKKYNLALRVSDMKSKMVNKQRVKKS
jgi:DNA-binding XRE family transcriptional regulator